MATWQSVDLPFDVVGLILDYLPLHTLYRIILCRHGNVYFNLVSSSLRSFRLNSAEIHTVKLHANTVDAIFKLVCGEGKNNITHFDIEFSATSNVAENELAQRILSLVQKQSVVHSFVLTYPYKSLPSQESFFRALSSYNCITHLRSFRCNATACADQLLSLLQRTPHLEELIIDDRYSKVIPLIPQLPLLTPKLRLLIFSNIDPHSQGELSWSCLAPLKELKNLSKLMVPRAFQRLGWRKALEFLPPSLALNICFADMCYARNYEGSGLSFLHDVIAENYVTQARELIELGAQVGRYSDPVGVLWRTKPLDDAICRNLIHMCRLFIESGAALSDPRSPHRGSLFPAIAFGHLPAIELLIDTMEEGKYETWYPMSPVLFNARTGESVFHAAAGKKDPAPLRLLLAKVPKDIINVNHLDGFGLPPLAYVASADHADVLLEHGADPNIVIQPNSILLIEFLLKERRFCKVAEELLRSEAFLWKAQLSADLIETLLDGARHSGSKTRHIFSSTYVLEVMIKTYPADKLDDMLQRINFWLSLPVFTPVAPLLAVVQARLGLTFAWRPEMTAALNSSLKAGLESQLKDLEHLLSLRPETIDIVLPLLFEPDAAKQAQERTPKFFETLANSIMMMLKTYRATSLTLTDCLFKILRSLKLGGNVTHLISVLLLRGASPVDAERSSSLILELCNRNYPGVIKYLLEYEPALRMFGSPAHDLEGMSLAKEKHQSRHYGWTAQLITALEQRMEQNSQPSVSQ